MLFDQRFEVGKTSGGLVEGITFGRQHAEVLRAETIEEPYHVIRSSRECVVQLHRILNAALGRVFRLTLRRCKGRRGNYSGWTPLPDAGPSDAESGNDETTGTR
jgi:hypothetical protein